jgi:hypothetical protein
MFGVCHASACNLSVSEQAQDMYACSLVTLLLRNTQMLLRVSSPQG